jgi:hypothetical protein
MKGGVFLRKTPLGCAASVYSNSKTAVAAAWLLPFFIAVIGGFFFGPLRTPSAQQLAQRFNASRNSCHQIEFRYA